MPFKEKFTWISLVVFVVVPGAYLAHVARQVADTPVRRDRLPAADARGHRRVDRTHNRRHHHDGDRDRHRHRDAGEGSTDDIGRDDERDNDIEVRGRGGRVLRCAVGMLAALALAMLRYDQFWIANVLYLGFVASSVTARS